MSTRKKANNPWPAYKAEASDGRRQRSSRSRRRIIEAMFELLRDGNLAPSAAEVADRADVGLRSVFRHFEDMDSIYYEMTEEIQAIAMPRVMAPFEATTWREQLFECIERRAEIYEVIFPIKLAMAMRYFQSEFIQKQYKRDLALERSSLKVFLPKEIVSNRILFSAIEASLSFVTWRRLRQDQNLSVTNAKASMRLMVEGLIAQVDRDE
ncbi:MAG: TetR/AcrR family transcriptional regulator [Pseudomonadota bacterium]